MNTRPDRTLYLVAYDVADPRRLAQVSRAMKGWKIGGQKSFCECWLTPAERAALLRQIGGLILPEQDRVHLFQLDPRMTPRCYGVAHTFDQPFFSIF